MAKWKPIYGVLTVGGESGDETRRTSRSGFREGRAEISLGDCTWRLTVGANGEYVLQYLEKNWNDAQRALVTEWETLADGVMEE